MFLLPDPNFLGVFPVLYSLDVEENHQVERFWKGWVFDEMVSMAILNPRGIARCGGCGVVGHGSATYVDVQGHACSPLPSELHTRRGCSGAKLD
jgi:hypothetical protein